MPTWTLAELMSNATARIGMRSDLSANVVRLWVNQAYQDFVREVPELLMEKVHTASVVSGTSFISLPSDFYEATSVVLGSTQLRRLTPEACDVQANANPGQPEGFYIFGDKLYLWPSANSSGSGDCVMRYRAIPSDLSASNDVPSVNTQHRIAILFKAEQYLHELVGNFEEAAASALRYTTLVTTLKDALARRQADRGRHAISLETARGVTRRLDEEDD